ncbi:MAG: ACP S-malonyltransferase [Lachnospiraceae bacterium]|nr:ACP S-malonyltransferase [Lachnospiraceae bacterium]
MKTIWMYAGQGSQREGMGKDLYENFPIYRQVIDGLELSFDVKAMMHEGELAELSKTKYTQPCMAAFGAGVTAVLKAAGLAPDGACGLSLGEYGALHAAGVLDANTYVSLVEFRGQAMEKAAQELKDKGNLCSMSAILGLEEAEVKAACEEALDAGFVVPVNFNCPGQCVICGDEEGVKKAEEKAKEKGAKRCMRLNVGGPFHTKYMSQAGEELGGRLQETAFQTPAIPVALNATGELYRQPEGDAEGKELKELLVKQIQSSVYFEKDIRAFLEAGADTFVEIGPGSTLSGFVEKTAKAMGKAVTIVTLDKAEDLEKYLASQ